MSIAVYEAQRLKKKNHNNQILGQILTNFTPKPMLSAPSDTQDTELPLPLNTRHREERHEQKPDAVDVKVAEPIFT